jgi:bla regulator protein blaR1
MNLFVTAMLLGLIVFLLVGPLSSWLGDASWVSRAPRAAVALWQSIGVSAIAAGIGAGLCIAVDRYHVGFFSGVRELVVGMFSGRPLAGIGLPNALGLTLAADLGVVMVFVLGSVMVRTVAARARHRRLLNLLTHSMPAHPDAELLNDPRAVAYCLPGRRPRIVVSAGTLGMLSEVELAAVVEHERGHAAEHHGLVMLPMSALSDLFKWIPYARFAPRAVGELLEMAADDFAARRHSPKSLASALVQLAISGQVPSCALGLASKIVPRRVRRLIDSNRTSRQTAVVISLAAGAVMMAPLALMLSS